MAHEAGKGPAMRKGADQAKFSSGFDLIQWPSRRKTQPTESHDAVDKVEPVKTNEQGEGALPET